MSDEKVVTDHDWGPGVKVSERVVKDKDGKEGVIRDVVFPPFQWDCVVCGANLLDPAQNKAHFEDNNLLSSEQKAAHKYFDESVKAARVEGPASLGKGTP